MIHQLPINHQCSTSWKDKKREVEALWQVDRWNQGCERRRKTMADQCCQPFPTPQAHSPLAEFQLFKFFAFTALLSSVFSRFLFTYGHVHSPNDNIKVLCIVMRRGSDETGRSFISAPVVSDRERRIRGAATNRYWRPLRNRDAARLSFLLKHRYVHSNTANFHPHCSGVIIISCRSLFLSLVVGIYLEISIGRNNLWFEKINRWIVFDSFWLLWIVSVLKDFMN